MNGKASNAPNLTQMDQLDMTPVPGVDTLVDTTPLVIPDNTPPQVSSVASSTEVSSVASSTSRSLSPLGDAPAIEDYPMPSESRTIADFSKWESRPPTLPHRRQRHPHGSHLQDSSSHHDARGNPTVYRPSGDLTFGGPTQGLVDFTYPQHPSHHQQHQQHRTQPYVNCKLEDIYCPSS